MGNFPFGMNTVKEDRAHNSEDISKDNVKSQDDVTKDDGQGMYEQLGVNYHSKYGMDLPGGYW